MRAGAAKKNARASFLSVPGPQNRTHADPTLASLVQRQCSVIVAVGKAPVASALARAEANKGVTFVVVRAGEGVASSNPSGTTPANVLVVPETAKKALTSAVATDVVAHIQG